MNFRQTRLLVVFMTIILFLGKLNAQVTIGSDEKTVSGAILQLKNIKEITNGSANATKGLGLPRVNLRAHNDLFPCAENDQKEKHTGLVVYNMLNIELLCVGLYVWDSEQWQRLSPGECAPLGDAPYFKETVNSCLDIVKSNWGVPCGYNNTPRTNSPTRITTAKQFAYTFNSGDASILGMTGQLAFRAIDDKGVIASLEPLSPLPSTLVDQTDYVVNLKFNNEVFKHALGRTSSDPLNIQIYATFDGVDYGEPMEITVVDCINCSTALPICEPVSITSIKRTPDFTAGNNFEYGTVINMSVVSIANGGTVSNISYQWQLNGVNIVGATGKTLDILQFRDEHVGDYTCVVVGCTGVPAIANFGDLTITIPPCTTPVSLVSTSHDANTWNGHWTGEEVELSVVVAGSQPIKYQWKKDDVDIAGAIDPKYIKVFTWEDSGNYTCVVTGCDGSTLTADLGYHHEDVGPMVDPPSLSVYPYCLDVRQSNFDATCGLEVDRTKADLTKAIPFTFHEGWGHDIQKVTFEWIDPEGVVDLANSPLPTLEWLGSGLSYTISLKLNDTALVKATGRTNANPITVTLTASFPDYWGQWGPPKAVISITDCKKCN